MNDENGRWVTINGRKVFIRTNEHPMNAFIKQSIGNKAKSEEQIQQEKEELKEKIKQKVQEMNEFVQEHGAGLTSDEAEIYKKMHKEVEDMKYNLETNYLKEISEKSIKDDRLTGFEKSVYVQARKENLKNKDVYDALSEATFGVYINSNTPVDDILEGKNSKVSAKELYDTFKGTRKELKKNYGDEVTLYRVESRQMAKPTKNYGSSIAYTKQYGDNVQEYKVKVDDIVAIWTNRKGTYEDVIVAVDGANKYIKRK